MRLDGKEEVDDESVSFSLFDTIYCHNPDVADDLYDHYTKKGYQVAISSVQIKTGTHGDCVVKKLEVFN